MVEFDSADTAETAIGKPFQPLVLRHILTLYSQIHRLSVWWSSLGHHFRQVSQCRCETWGYDGDDGAHGHHAGPNHVICDVSWMFDSLLLSMIP